MERIRYFGYKLSVNADRCYKLIRKIAIDTASVHDGQHFEAVFDRTNTSADVYADRGYPSQERESVTCTRIFGPSGFRDNGLLKQRGSDEEVEVYGRADRSDFAGS